jgi:hypothetical protein
MANLIENMPEPRSEGRLTRQVERETSRIPSVAFLSLAGVAIAASLVLQSVGRKETSLFVGQWAPTLLVLGLYNKMVKVAGHDSSRSSRGGRELEGLEASH